MKRMSDLLVKANEYLSAHRAVKRLSYHITPRFGWLNDPNGLVYFKGEYHVFYQTCPFETENTSIFWGHVKSRNLVEWEECPLALAPDREYDRDGCYTGSAVVRNEVLFLLYTGHRNTEDGYKETQNIAYSRDGLSFEKYEGNPVIRERPPHTTRRFRDPKVWRQGSLYYAVIGAEDDNGFGKTVLYCSEDMLHFKYSGVFADSSGELGNMWECPNFVHMGDKDILILSPKGLKEGQGMSGGFDCGYFSGYLNWDRKFYRKTQFGRLDYGFDFYAPQVLYMQERNILFGWLSMPDSERKGAENGWMNALSIPRELWLDETGALCMRPVAELLNLRKEKTAAENLAGGSVHYLPEEAGDSLEVILHIKAENETKSRVCKISGENPSGKMEFKILSNNDSVFEFSFDEQAGSIELTRGEQKSETAVGRFSIKELRIFIDGTAVEIFLNDGRYVFSSRFYPEKSISYEVIVPSGKSACLETYRLRRVFSER